MIFPCSILKPKMNATLPPLRPFPGSKWQAPQCKLIKSSMKQKQRVCPLSPLCLLTLFIFACSNCRHCFASPCHPERDGSFHTPKSEQWCTATCAWRLAWNSTRKESRNTHLFWACVRRCGWRHRHRLSFFWGGGGEVAYLTDPKYLNQKKDQFLQVFPTYEILGWYTSGSNLVDRDQIPHKVCFVWGGNLWGFGHRARPLGISTLWESFSCTHSHIPNFQFTMPTHKYPAFPWKWRPGIFLFWKKLLIFW